MSHRDPPPGQVVQEVFYHPVGIPLAGQRTMDKVDAQRPDSLLLQLGCVVQHPDVDQDLVGSLPEARNSSKRGDWGHHWTWWSVPYLLFTGLLKEEDRCQVSNNIKRGNSCGSCKLLTGSMGVRYDMDRRIARCLVQRIKNCRNIGPSGVQDFSSGHLPFS